MQGRKFTLGRAAAAFPLAGAFVVLSLALLRAGASGPAGTQRAPSPAFADRPALTANPVSASGAGAAPRARIPQTSQASRRQTRAPLYDEPLGIFDGHCDIGPVEKPGSVAFEADLQTYIIGGAGDNMWADSDQCHFLWKRIKGDFILSAKVQFIGTGGAARRKIGWMARTSLDTDSAHASTVVHGDGMTALQYRKTRGARTAEDGIGVTGPNQIQLERRGNSYIMSVAAFGEMYFRDRIDNIDLGDEVYAGLFVCSHNPNVLEKALFSNVLISLPAKAGFIPYRDYLGSRLEIVDVGTKNRTVVLESPRPIESPNWTKDGQALIYNSDGALYRFDLETGRSTAIDTGAAKPVTDDHVLSFNGKMLGFSSLLPSAGDMPVIYAMPAAGGRVWRVTPKGPSYLHGWSPDGKNLVYTGPRNGNVDVYRISVRGGNEKRLTKDKGIDDGPEYTPDGRFIYFNSNRAGTMQIWRMLANGRAQRPVTRGNAQDWFPHVSPDGRWIAFLTYERDVGPDDHPFYKQVYIRMLAVGSRDEPRVVAYLYGGQGTINVSSWSPDSQRIAFVSYTGGIR